MDIIFNEKNILKTDILRKFKFKRTYENICEIIFIIKYIIFYKNINLEKLNDTEIFNKIISVYNKIYSLIPDIKYKRIECVT
jgi:hypothetical protein